MAQPREGRAPWCVCSVSYVTLPMPPVPWTSPSYLSEKHGGWHAPEAVSKLWPCWHTFALSCSYLEREASTYHPKSLLSMPEHRWVVVEQKPPPPTAAATICLGKWEEPQGQGCFAFAALHTWQGQGKSCVHHAHACLPCHTYHDMPEHPLTASHKILFFLPGHEPCLVSLLKLCTHTRAPSLISSSLPTLCMKTQEASISGHFQADEAGEETFLTSFLFGFERGCFIAGRRRGNSLLYMSQILCLFFLTTHSFPFHWRAVLLLHSVELCLLPIGGEEGGHACLCRWSFSCFLLLHHLCMMGTCLLPVTFWEERGSPPAPLSGRHLGTTGRLVFSVLCVLFSVSGGEGLISFHGKQLTSSLQWWLCVPGRKFMLFNFFHWALLHLVQLGRRQGDGWEGRLLGNSSVSLHFISKRYNFTVFLHQVSNLGFSHCHGTTSIPGT